MRTDCSLTISRSIRRGVSALCRPPWMLPARPWMQIPPRHVTSVARWEASPPPPPVDRRNDTRLWKHYLHATTVAGGKKPKLLWNSWICQTHSTKIKIIVPGLRSTNVRAAWLHVGTTNSTILTSLCKVTEQSILDETFPFKYMPSTVKSTHNKSEWSKSTGRMYRQITEVPSIRKCLVQSTGYEEARTLGNNQTRTAVFRTFAASQIKP